VFVPQQVDIESQEHDDKIIGTMFWRSVIVFSVLALAVGAAAGAWWLSQTKKAPSVIATEHQAPAIRKVVEAPALPFTDITKAAGIAFVHENGAIGEKLLPETMGSGCAFLDYDNDGDADLLFVNSCRWPWDKRPASRAPTMALYENDGKGQFVDMTSKAGLDVTFYGMGVACGDYDGDGWTDVFITAVGKNHLFRNEKGHFTETTATAGVSGAESEWSTSAAFLDYDNDGDLDLFVANYVRWSREIDSQQGFKLDGQTRAYGPPMSFEGTFPYLYRNEGSGKFTDVSAPSGVQVKNPVSNVPVAKSMGIVPIDIDADGYLDLVIANDTVQNFVLMNQKDGTFHEIGIGSGVGLDPATGGARGAMGEDAAYFRNDECLGIAIGNFANEMTALYVSKPHEASFLDEATASGLGPPTRQELTFGIFFIDCDLDGRQDILAANGHLEQEINKVQSSQFYEQPPHLLWNAGPEEASEFVSVPVDKVGQSFAKRMVGRGSAYADIDGDGDQDVVITANGGTPRLLRNDQKSGHHWLRLKLVGSGKSREALGAVVKLKTGPITQTRVVMATRSYCSQSELPVTFGLGTKSQVDAVEIRWPDGTKQSVTIKNLDQQMTIEQKSAK
jgi:hypothetical protein